MKNRNFCISRNLTVLRQIHKYSQEEVAEKIGVSRQAVAKWESGETAPDLINCDALAELYNVSVDDLIQHIFGTVKVGERGQIVLPKKARDIFHIKPGDLLVVLGDEDPERAGIALVHGDSFLKSMEFLQKAVRPAEADKEDNNL